MTDTTVWMLTGADVALPQARQVCSGDTVLRARGDRPTVGTVDDGLTVEWVAEVDADLLPDGETITRGGPTQRIECAPALFDALRRLEEARALHRA